MLKILGKHYAPFMLDVETTGLSPVLNSITSIALVRFSTDSWYPLKTIHFRFADRLPGRYHSPDTLAWRHENNVDEMELKLPAYTIVEGLRLISDFIMANSRGKIPILLSKHIDFDVAFLKGYYAVRGYMFPYTHRNIFDLDSVIHGMNVDADSAFNAAKLDMKGIAMKPHDALYDCLFQIKYFKKTFELQTLESESHYA